MAFPSTAKLAFGYDKTRASAVDRSSMEDGMVKQAKVKSRVLVTRSFTYYFDAFADYTGFITWYQTTINYGADWFNWTDPEDGVVKLARIVSQLDKEKPTRKVLDRWQIDMKIETWSA